MEKNPMKNDARKERRKRKYGDPMEMCLLCGLKNPENAKELGINLFERHHVAGRDLEPDLTVVLCKPCHEFLQEGLRGAGLEELAPDTDLERTGGLCLGLADLFEVLTVVLREHGQRVFRLQDALDREHPEWRDEEPDVPEEPDA